MVRREAPVLVSGLKSATSGHPCPSGYQSSKKERFMTRCIEAPPRGGDFSPLFCPCPYGGTPLFPNHGPGLQSWEACVLAEEKRCGLYFLTFFYFWYLVIL